MRDGAAQSFHGIFRALQQLDIFDQPASDDLYGDTFADFWNAYFGDDVSDIPIYQALLASEGAQVLDLACGGGRIGIGLAREGVRVDGIELSPAMLALVERNLAHQAPEVATRLRFYQGNMCSFALPDRYDLIVLGTTSISLLPDAAARAALFRCVKAHLAPGGRFVFDLLDLGQERWKQLDHYLDVWSRETDQGQEFAIVGQRFYPEQHCFTFNVYRETIGWDGATTRTLGSSTKTWIEVDAVAQELPACGLRLADRIDRADLRYFVATAAEE